MIIHKESASNNKEKQAYTDSSEPYDLAVRLLLAIVIGPFRRKHGGRARLGAPARVQDPTETLRAQEKCLRDERKQTLDVSAPTKNEAGTNPTSHRIGRFDPLPTTRARVYLRDGRGGSLMAADGGESRARRGFGRERAQWPEARVLRRKSGEGWRRR